MTLSRSNPHAKQRWGLLAMLVFALTLLGAALTLAVHDVSVFQLDGDAQVATGTSHLEDWDVICNANPTTCTFQDGYDTSGIVASTATRSSHASDGSLNATIFTGGGSKDPEDISAWAWKDGAGGLPDKDNLLHSYAARYVVDASTTCPNGTTNPISGKCTLLYFGADRYANEGDAHMAFWFLQNKVTLGSNKVGGGTGFNGVHKAGDLLVISGFSNGGTVATINIFKWVNSGGDASEHLQFLAGSDDAKCSATLASPDRFCGIVNPADGTTSPWEFTNKGGRSTFDQGQLYEAGINLSDPSINLGDTCFSSFVAETRSSTSPTAVLKDFVLGQFAVCAPGMTTRASTNGTVVPGTEVHDTATVAITGASNATDPTGDVTFYLCKPAITDPLSDCGTSTGTLIGTGTLVGGTTANDGTATAESPKVNCASDLVAGCAVVTPTVNPLAPGRYCFRATWPGDSTYVLATPLNVTNSTTECFSVKDTSSITTAQSWLPQDSATVTTAGGTAVAGKVVFSLYENGICSGTAATTFEDTSAPFATNNTTYRTTSTIISWSATFTPTDTNALAGSTTTRCEKSDLTINNSATAFPPPAP